MEHRGMVSLLAFSIYCVLCLVLFLTSCTSGEVGAAADEAVPECTMVRAQDPLRGREELVTYAGRHFLTDGNHLGWDIELAEGWAVYPIGCGTVKVARAARGYGTYVVVIEHRLASGLTVQNGAGEQVFVDRFLSIYGHMRPTSERNGRGMNRVLHVGDLVTPTTTLGYIENGASNGDGEEHLHLGIRLQSEREAMSVDPAAWFRGYDTTPSLARWFADPEVFLRQLSSDHVSPLTIDAGSSSADIGSDHPLVTTPELPMDIPIIHERETVADVPLIDVPRVAPDVPMVVFRDVSNEPLRPSHLRYEFRIQSALRVAPPYRLRDQWWRPVMCLNTGSLDPQLMPDGYARCEAERIEVFDGSISLLDHPDWGDSGQIGTIANTPSRCTPVQGAEWRITDLETNRMLFMGSVSALRCMSVGSQDRLRLPD